MEKNKAVFQPWVFDVKLYPQENPDRVFNQVWKETDCNEHSARRKILMQCYWKELFVKRIHLSEDTLCGDEE